MNIFQSLHLLCIFKHLRIDSLGLHTEPRPKATTTLFSRASISMFIEEVAAELRKRQGPVLGVGCAVDGSSISDLALGASLNLANTKRQALSDG